MRLEVSRLFLPNFNEWRCLRCLSFSRWWKTEKHSCWSSVISMRSCPPQYVYTHLYVETDRFINSFLCVIGISHMCHMIQCHMIHTFPYYIILYPSKYTCVMKENVYSTIYVCITHTCIFRGWWTLTWNTRSSIFFWYLSFMCVTWWLTYIFRLREMNCLCIHSSK